MATFPATCGNNQGSLGEYPFCSMSPSSKINLISLTLPVFFLVGCKNVTTEREKIDATAYGIIRDKQEKELGKVEPFSIERPSDLLRRRRIEEQGLPITSLASLGSDRLKHA